MWAPNEIHLCQCEHMKICTDAYPPLEPTMKTIRTLFRRPSRTGSRFDRYYGEVLRSGVGYPTADEARRDMQRHATASQPFGWYR